MTDTSGGSKDDRGFDSYIPIWDGRHESLRDFRKQVTWWLQSIDLTKTTTFNLAARFALRQKGTAKLRALEFNPSELAYIPAEEAEDPDTGEKLTLVEPIYDAGITKILNAWDEMIGRSVTDRKGELRERYYLQIRRGASESVSNFALRYRTLIAEMKNEGISVDEGEQAWFYKQKLQLTELQKQMLETTLGALTEDYGACERESIRLFKRVHYGGGPRPGGAPTSFGKRPTSLTASTLSRFRRSLPSSSSSTSTTSSWRRGGKGSFTSSAYVTENEMAEDDGGQEALEAVQENAEDGDGEENYDDDEELQGLQSVLETMATELDEVAEAGLDEEELQGIEERIDGAVEALVTLREARTQINSLKRDRGFHGGKGGGKSKTKGGGKEKPGGCFACGDEGHWAGDPECKGPSKGGGKSPKGPRFPKPMKKQNHGGSQSSHSSSPQKSTGYRSEAHTAEVNVMDLLPSVSDATFRSVAFDDKPSVHEILMVGAGSLAEALATSTSGSMRLDPDKRYIAAVDTACNKTCAGEEWLALVLDALKFAPDWVQQLITEVKAVDYFRFGNGGTLVSEKRIRIPVCILGQVVLVWISSIPCNSLGCLVGKDVLECLGAILDVVNKKMQLKFLGDSWIPLSKMKAGHFSLNLFPMDLTAWPVPSALSWHGVGIGGVCGVQCEGRYTWKAKKLSVCSSPVDRHGDLHYTVNYIPEPCISSFVESDIGNAESPDSVESLFGAMAEDVDTTLGEAAMALARSSTLAGAETFPEVPSVPASYGGFNPRLESPSGGCGETESMAEIMVAEGGGEDERHSPTRMSGTAVSSGHDAGVHGGRSSDVRDQSPEAAPSSPAASGSGTRSPQSSTRSRWPTRRTGTRADRSERRTSPNQARLGEAGIAAEGVGGGQGHERDSQREVETHGTGLDGEDFDEWMQANVRIQQPNRRAGSLSTSTSNATSSARSRTRSSGRGQSADSLRHAGDLGWTDRFSDPGRSGLGDGTPVLSAERRARSASVRASIGGMNRASFKDVRSGVRIMVRDSVRKAQKIRNQLGAPKDYVLEAMEVEYTDFLQTVATGEYTHESLVSEVMIPHLPGTGPRLRSWKLPTPSLKEPLPVRKDKRTDEWRIGHFDGWICRDHYLPRRGFYTPGVVTAPRYFPPGAFTGERRTLVLDEEGNIEHDVMDNFLQKDDPVVLREPWLGETWFRMHQWWIRSQYKPCSIYAFRQEIQNLIYQHGDSQGVYTLTNGDKVFIGRNTMSSLAVLPADENIPISTFMFTMEDGRTVLEEKVRYKDRACLRLKNANLIKAVQIFVMIQYDSERNQEPGYEPLVGELYTETEPVSNCAIRRGHQIMPSITLKTGYDLLRAAHRKRACKDINSRRPFCLVIAFPCSV